MRHFSPSIVPHTLSRMGWCHLIRDWYSSIFSRDGIFIIAFLFQENTFDRILLPNWMNFVIFDIIKPNINYSTITDLCVLVQARTKPKPSAGVLDCNDDRDGGTFSKQNHLSYHKVENIHKTMAKKPMT